MIREISILDCADANSSHLHYIHTGCAATLRGRFDPSCGGAKHGDLRDLEGEQLDDLVKYLETL